MQYQTTYADKNAWQTVGKRMNLFFVASYRILICFHSRSIQRSKFGWNHFQIIMPGKIGLFVDMLKQFIFKISKRIMKKLPQSCPRGLFDQEIRHQTINDEWYDRYDDFYFSGREYREQVDHLKNNFINGDFHLTTFDLPIFMVFPGAIWIVPDTRLTSKWPWILQCSSFVASKSSPSYPSNNVEFSKRL